MKTILPLIFSVLIFASCSSSASREETDTQTQAETQTPPPSPYLGMDPPGMSPVEFAPGIVNTDSVELNAVFNRDMTEFYFTRIINGSMIIHQSTLEDGEWTAPSPLNMYPDYSDIRTTAVDMTFTADGNTMYFLGRIDEGPDKSSADIYRSERVNGTWQPGTRIDELSTDEHAEYYPVVVNEGSIYFVSTRPGGVGPRDVWRAQYLGDGKFDVPVSTGPTINTEFGSGDTYVSPDETYMIYSTKMDSTDGMRISFKKDGEWQTPIYLGDEINTEHTDFCPYMSPDEKVFFFSRRYSDPVDSGWNGVVDGKVFWMDAESVLGLNNE